MNSKVAKTHANDHVTIGRHNNLLIMCNKTENNPRKTFEQLTPLS